MRFRPFTSLIALTASLAVIPHAAPPLAAPPDLPDLLLILPPDTARVAVAADVSTAALGPETSTRPSSRKTTPSPAALVARAVVPVFGASLTRMINERLDEDPVMGGVEAIDSSASRMAFTEVDPDSSRYRLVLDTLRVAQSARTVARRTVPPSPPAYDPATGAMTPGTRRATTEGPGRVTTLTLAAAWTIVDRAADADAAPILARGMATGRAEFRGGMNDARRADWEAAARALALDLIGQPPFVAPKAGP